MIASPIVLFVYNRPQHARQTIDALTKNDLAARSELIIMSDGARSETDSDRVAEVRRHLHAIRGFQNVTIVERANNRGLAKSIVTGVTEVLRQYESVIVLEDDLVTSPFFLRYINDGLTLYREEEQVASIHGYVYPVNSTLPASFFLRGADCWGWGTWKRAWDIFEADGSKLLSELYKGQLTRKFDLDGSHPYTTMLQDQINGKNDSWAIRWYASAFLRGMYTLYPGTSLVKNIGLDSTGTHCGTVSDMIIDTPTARLDITKLDISENKWARREISKFLGRQNESSRKNRIVEICKKVF
jgi:glycosyltransferase involved in cell wall biosynthesis